MAPPEKILCPSARCEPGSILLGIVQEDGRIAYLPEGFVIDREWVERAHRGRNPESRFRFSSKCVASHCREWQGGRCSVPKRAREQLGATEEATARPDCAIRPQCRWHQQEGDGACAVCPLVITDILEPEAAAVP